MKGAPNLRDREELEIMMKKHASNGGLYGAICAAPAVVLSSWGLLNGLKVSSIFSNFLYVLLFICLGLLVNQNANYQPC
jgi:protein deglycase